MRQYQARQKRPRQLALRKKWSVAQVWLTIKSYTQGKGWMETDEESWGKRTAARQAQVELCATPSTTNRTNQNFLCIFSRPCVRPAHGGPRSPNSKKRDRSRKQGPRQRSRIFALRNGTHARAQHTTYKHTNTHTQTHTHTHTHTCYD